MKLSEVVAKYSSPIEFLSALRQEVYQLGKEKSDFVYNPGHKGACSYFEPARKFDHQIEQFVIVGPECSGCIFGQALQKMGWTARDEAEGSITTILSRVEINKNYGIKSDFDSFYSIVEIFQNIQTSQDMGNSWGKAVTLMDLFVTREIFKV